MEGAASYLGYLSLVQTLPVRFWIRLTSFTSGLREFTNKRFTNLTAQLKQQLYQKIKYP